MAKETKPSGSRPGPKAAGPKRIARARRGRATPKGTPARAGTTSGRYTPPVPRTQKVSPVWVPVIMFACLGLGMVIIVSNYLGMLPGDAKNSYLLIGLGLITVGFITATRYH